MCQIRNSLQALPVWAICSISKTKSINFKSISILKQNVPCKRIIATRQVTSINQSNGKKWLTNKKELSSLSVYTQPDAYHYRHFNLIEWVQHKTN